MFSQNWFRVAALKPRLRPHARVHRQLYRGEPWFVIQDDQTGRYHRLSPAANHMVALMNGQRTTEEIWRAACDWAGDEAPPSQDDAIRLLAQLHGADLLSGDLPPDIEELARRADKSAARQLMSRLKNPMAIRIPLIDPDRFLTATMPLVRPLFSWVGLALWLIIVALGALVAVIRWEELTTGLVDQVLLAENLLILLFVYPAVKALHELGHGYAVKRWGGEAREMGIMFLVFMPVPYVDASSASAFPSKWARAVVGGAGIMVELLIAALAIMFWATAEPGLLRAAAFNAALIGGVSTLLFNGNPLLRFDGYYVLTDLIEIPNLGNRANRHFFYVLKRYLLGLKDETSPATARGERTWFFLYAVAAFIYRLFIMIGIALFVAGKFFFIGIILALWAIFNSLVMPLLKGAWWLIDSPALRRRRGRALAITGAGLGLAAAALFAAPLPYGTVAQGVVWLPQEAFVRAEADGFVARVEAASDAPVAPGAPIVTLEDPGLTARGRVLAAQKAELTTRLRAAGIADRTQEAILRRQIEHVDAAAALNDTRLAAQSVAAPRAGRLILPGADRLTGRYVRRGDLLAYVVAPGDQVLRVAVPQGQADLVRRRAEGVSLRFIDQPDRIFPARIIRETPKATFDLPSAALTTAGGGALSAEPGGDGARALEAVFLFDVALPAEATARDLPLGLRAHVRFDHGTEPLGWRIARAIRQLFLAEFDV